MPARMNAPLKIGVISFAMYHANFWSQAVKRSGKAALVGIWDPDEVRGRRASVEYETTYWTSLDEMLGASDAVLITSETARHVEFIERAAARRRHVLCEKPITTTLLDCDRVERAVSASGITFMQSYPKRFDPVNQELKRMIDAGELGDITFMRVRHGHYYGLMGGTRHSGWTHDSELSGGGALLDEGCHGADLIRWLLGEPDAVTAVISHKTMKLDVEDLGVALFVYDRGPICELASSTTFVGGDNSVEVWGTRGAAIVSGVDLASRDLTSTAYLKVCKLTDECRTDPTRRKWIVSDVVPGFANTSLFHQQNVEQFIDTLIEGRDPPITVRDGRRSLQMILSAYESARTGCMVRIPGEA